MNNILSNDSDGLPDIGQKTKKRKSLFVFIIGMIFISVIGYLGIKKDGSTSLKQTEEVYRIPGEVRDESVIRVDNSHPVITEKINSPENVGQDQSILIREKQKELNQRLLAPLMVINSNTTGLITESNKDNVNDQSLKVDDNQSATAKIIGPLNSIIAEGNFIHAVIESATDSDLKGSLRAIVSEPVYSEDATRILIPRGSRLIGQYKNNIQQGQSRIYIIWDRVITPTGFSIELKSAGVDTLGVSGMGADEIDRHFWTRFGMASLLSIISAGTANIGTSNLNLENPATSYRTGLANSFSQSAEQSLQQQSNIPPTLKSYQGKPIVVFVSRDLNFQSVLKTTQPKVNLF